MKLAEGALLEHSFVSRLEAGSRLPTFASVTRILHSLGISRTSRKGRKLYHAAGFSLGDEIPLTELPDPIRQLLELYPDMLPSERTFVGSMLRVIIESVKLNALERERAQQERLTPRHG